MKKYNVYSVKFAGHSDISPIFENLNLWIKSDSFSTLIKKLEPFKNIFDLTTISKIEIDPDKTLGIDFSTDDSYSFIKEKIQKTYSLLLNQKFFNLKLELIEISGISFDNGSHIEVKNNTKKNIEKCNFETLNFY